MKLGNLVSGISVISLTGRKEVEIQGIAYNSKSVKKDDLFAAVRGERVDGFDYLQEAVAKGAMAVLSERPKPAGFSKPWVQVAEARKSLAFCAANFYSHPSQKLKIVGITGTKGKTTVSYLLEEIIRKAGFEPGVIGTISYRGPGLDISAERTTPEALDLQRMLREMLDRGATHCVMEVSSHSLDLCRVEGIEFDLAVFTNLSGEHLDYHHSLENYFEAKKKLFSPGLKNKMGVVNVDDPWGKRLTEEIALGAITYGLKPQAIIRGEDFHLGENGLTCVVKSPSGQMAISSPLLGKPNLYNILAATAAALTLNISIRAITDGVASLQGVPGRFEKVENSLGVNIFVDYAHTDDALRNLLETARELCSQRIILVFGAGGDRDRTKRPRMGEEAAALADWTILTSDNPRSEYPLDIIRDIEAGMKKTGEGKYEIQPNRKEAIRRALSLAKKGDCVLVAGKGHENYQIIRDKVLPFNDVEVVQSLLAEKEAR